MSLKYIFKEELYEIELYNELTTKEEKDFEECETIYCFYSKIFVWIFLITFHSGFCLFNIKRRSWKIFFKILIVTKRAANLKEDSFNDRKFNFKIDANSIAKVVQASSVFKRKLEEEKQIAVAIAKKNETTEN